MATNLVEELSGPSGPFAITYTIEQGSPDACSTSEYFRWVSSKWNCLLNDANIDEAAVQGFFEQHVCMLPAVDKTFGGLGGHGYFPNAVITQPRLAGIISKVPDFLCIARNSAGIYATFIEIEDPKKPWATRTGQKAHELTQAMNQITEWQAWFNVPSNQQAFLNDYRLPSEWIRSRSFFQRYILIYGRRSDLSLTEEVSRQREFWQPKDTTIMTYDRLQPERNHTQYITATLDAAGYRALHIPPTFRLGPVMAPFRALIRDLNKAIETNSQISQERKLFLLRRSPYWDEWVRNGGGTLNVGDWE